MTCILLLLFYTSVTGLFLHELLGLGLFLLFCLHVVLNRNWIRGILTRRIKNAKTKGMLLLDCILLVTVLGTTFSGLLISRNLLAFIQKDRIFRTEFHQLFAYTMLLLTGLHIGFHWNRVLMRFRKIFSIKKGFKVCRFMCKGAALLLAAAGIYALTKPGVYSNFTGLFLPNDGTNQSRQPDKRKIIMAFLRTQFPCLRERPPWTNICPVSSVTAAAGAALCCPPAAVMDERWPSMQKFATAVRRFCRRSPCLQSRIQRNPAPPILSS